MAQPLQEPFERPGIAPQEVDRQRVNIVCSDPDSIATVITKWVIRFTPDANLIWVSEAACSQLGYRREVLINHSWLHFIYPDDRPALISHIAALTSEQPCFTTKQRIRFADGQVRWLEWTNHGIFDPQQQLIEIQAVGRDRVVEQQIEAALKQSQERFHSLIEVLSDWVWEVDVNAIYTYASPKVADILGYQPEAVLGKSCFDLMPLEEAERIAPIFRAIVAARQPFRYLENIALHKAGHFVVLESSGVPIFDDAGELQGYRGLDRDITARKQSESISQRAREAAEAANQVKSNFLANISHELRSPLNAVLGFSQLLTLSHSLSPAHQEYVNIISRSGDYLLNLINNILDLSKIEADCVTLEPSNFDLYRLLDDLKEMFCLQSSEKHLELKFDYGGEVPQCVRADELKVRQVLINLLSNAMKFTQQGSVTLRVEAIRAIPQAHTSADTSLTTPVTTQVLRFEVEDTGIGIALESLDEIFNAFVQTSAGRDLGEGTGLGLSISRAYVQLMGGNLTVYSHLGQGSKFQFDIAVDVVKPEEIQDRQSQSTDIGLAAQPQQSAIPAPDYTDGWQFPLAHQTFCFVKDFQSFVKKFLRVNYT
jgi:PAS domain S-box-containing protein